MTCAPSGGGEGGEPMSQGPRRPRSHVRASEPREGVQRARWRPARASVRGAGRARLPARDPRPGPGARALRRRQPSALQRRGQVASRVRPCDGLHAQACRAATRLSTLTRAEQRRSGCRGRARERASPARTCGRELAGADPAARAVGPALIRWREPSGRSLGSVAPAKGFPRESVARASAGRTPGPTVDAVGAIATTAHAVEVTLTPRSEGEPRATSSRRQGTSEEQATSAKLAPSASAGGTASSAETRRFPRTSMLRRPGG